MARLKKWIWAVGAVSSLVLCSNFAHGQAARLPSQRQNIPGDTQGAEAGGTASAFDMALGQSVNTPLNVVTDADPNYAVAANAVSAQIGNAQAHTNTLFQANNLTAFGASTFVPQVDTTGSVAGSATTQGGVANANWRGGAIARGTYIVLANPPEAPPFRLVSSLYLVSTGTGINETALNVTLFAQAAGSNVQAQAFGTNGFAVQGNLSRIGQPPQFIMQFRAAMNDLYVGEQLTAPGNVHIVRTDIRGNVVGTLPGMSLASGAIVSNGSINRGFSSDAWYAIY